MPYSGETQSQWEERMAMEALAITRSALYLDFRFLDMALTALSPMAEDRLHSLSTDGALLAYRPKWVLEQYKNNSLYLNRALLHTLFHCVFRHLWMRKQRDKNLWDLACDIAVEQVLDGLHQPTVERPLTYTRLRTYEAVVKSYKVVAAATVYRWLQTQSPEQWNALSREFTVDSHQLWPKDPPQNPQSQQLQKAWQRIGKRLAAETERHSMEAGSGTESLRTQVQAAAQSRRSYRDFLRKFCVLREELHLDPEEFDLGYYTYGLRFYGNMPLVEPNETRESYKIEELALVIDTSFSTSGELVQNFLKETYRLLQQQNSFFRHMNLHLIQADSKVQSDTVIACEADLQRCMESFTLQGGGGTDFRPAFVYVNELVERGKFRHLRGLLYFTDGLGIYPEKRPAYDTAFLFLGNHFDDTAVPPWAMKVIVEEEEFLP